MQLCKVCKIDMDRCDCIADEKPKNIEQMILQRIKLEKLVEHLRIEIIRERKRQGKIM